ncbi:oligosaccharide flippase family protein [Patescibacteria group bacterium]|nr:oligosaccharide flippase family protein [Patescibacteria group bacterium]
MKRFNKIITKHLTPLFLSKTAMNTYMIFVGNGLSAFLAFVFTVTLVRNVSLADFGYFSALLSFMMLVTDVSDTGIGSTLSAFLPPLEDDKKRFFSILKAAFILQTIIALVVTTVLFIFSYAIANILFHTVKLDLLVKITTLAIFFNIMGTFFTYVLSARQKFLQVAFLSAFSSLMRVVLLVCLILFSMVFLQNVLWIHVFYLLITAVIAFIFVDVEFLKFKKIPGELRKFVSFSYFIGIARGLTAIASRLDVLMLIAMTNPVQAGIYSTASRIISVYPLLTGSFSTVIAPRLSAATDHKSINKYIYKVIFATFGIMSTNVFLIIFARPFMITLFGTDKGGPAVTVLQLLLVAMMFFVGSIPSVALSIYYLRKPFIITFNSILQLIIVAVGNLVFIPKYGRLGPAVSLILAFGITLLLTSCMSFYYYAKTGNEKKSI